jgi:hypothetical protein
MQTTKGHHLYFYQSGDDGTDFQLVRYFDDYTSEVIARGCGTSHDRDARNLAALRNALQQLGLDADGKAQIEDAIRVIERRPHPAALE